MLKVVGKKQGCVSTVVFLFKKGRMGCFLSITVANLGVLSFNDLYGRNKTD